MICRLCLININAENAVFLFETIENRAEKELVKYIAKYLHLKLNQDDSFSTNVCQNCCDHLEDFHMFCLLVDQKQSTLRNEFLEVRCNLTLSATGETAALEEMLHDNNEEALLDWKSIPMGEASLVEEFVCVDNSSINSLEQLESDDNVINEDTDSTDDDAPLLTLLTKNKSSRSTAVKRRRLPRQKVKNRKEQPVLPSIQNEETLDYENLHAKTKSTKTAKPRNNHEVSKRNEETIDNFMKLSCELCKFPAETYSDLRTHFNLRHQRTAYVTCCGSKYNKANKLAEHIKWHQNPDIFKCDICDKRLRSKICLRVHNQFVHAASDDRSLICHICNKQFRNQKCLENHIDRHGIQREYKCENCNKCFLTPQRLRRHIESIHDNIYPHVCDTCGKKFKFKPSFERHLLEHRGIVDPPVQCTVCGEWLKNKNVLRLHNFKHDKKDVVCRVCGRQCPSRTALRGHMDYMHKRQKNLQCNYCNKTFKESKNLKEHVAMHTGAQLYSCPHCSKECRSKSNMYVHIKRFHVEEWIKSKNARSNDPSFKADAKQ